MVIASATLPARDSAIDLAGCHCFSCTVDLKHRARERRLDLLEQEQELASARALGEHSVKTPRVERLLEMVAHVIQVTRRNLRLSACAGLVIHDQSAAVDGDPVNHRAAPFIALAPCN